MVIVDLGGILARSNDLKIAIFLSLI